MGFGETPISIVVQKGDVKRFHFGEVFLGIFFWDIPSSGGDGGYGGYGGYAGFKTPPLGGQVPGVSSGRVLNPPFPETLWFQSKMESGRDAGLRGAGFKTPPLEMRKLFFHRY